MIHPSLAQIPRHPWPRLQRFGYRLGIGGAIALLWWLLVTSSGTAQETTPPAAEESDPAQAPPSLLQENPVIRPLEEIAPPEIRALFENTTPQADTSPVYLDGRVLFEVAALAESDFLTAVRRANEIEQRLESLAQETLELESQEELAVSFEIDQQTNQPVIYINGDVLMTVTYLDARISGTSSLTLRAIQMVNTIEDALVRYRQERQPEFLWERARWTAAALLLTLLGHCALAYGAQSLNGQRRRLQQAQVEPPVSPVDTTSPPVDSIRNTLLSQQRIKSLTSLKQALRVAQVALWIGSVLTILGLFPQTRWLQPLIVTTLRLPFRFLLIILVAYGLIRLSDVWIDRLFIAVQTRSPLPVERSQRLALRLSTFSQVVKGIIAVLIGSVAFFFMLSALGVRIAPLLAGAGLVGVAISFASQSLIKDIINGFLILLEDQYGVGDVIRVRDVSGFVENMNLRITQLRDTSGQLITIPNGQIDIVQNLSKEWSRVDLMIPVGLAADINQALHLVEQVATELSQDGIWGSLILEPPLLLGVDHLDHVGATIRLWIKTQPLKQWDVAREYRRRLKMAFEAAGIPIGVPQQIIHVNGAPLTTGTGESQSPFRNGTPSASDLGA